MFILPVLAASGILQIIEWVSPALRALLSVGRRALQTPQVAFAAGSIAVLLIAKWWLLMAKQLFSLFSQQQLFRWNVDSSLADTRFFWITTGFVLLNLSSLCLLLYKSGISRETVRSAVISCIVVVLGAMIYPVHIVAGERYYRYASTGWTSNLLTGVFLADADYVRKNSTRDDVLAVVSGRGRYYPEFLYYANRAGYEWSYEDLRCYLVNDDESCARKASAQPPDKIFIEYTKFNYWSGYFPASTEELERLIQGSTRVTLLNIFTTEQDKNTRVYELRVQTPDVRSPAL